tara:strand:+ start:11286 stop:12146 length:861 start_codon:yes stop_codon:yes gene_type:complete
MSGLFYFIPNVQGISSEAFSEYGLGTALSDVSKVGDDYIVAKVDSGPDHKIGSWLWPKDSNYPEKLPKKLGYHPEYQVYKPSKQKRNGQPLFYIGWWINDPPTIEDMKKTTAVPGYMIDCGYAEKSWQVPVARMDNEPCGTLSYAYDFDESGKVVPEVVNEHRALWEKSAIVWDFFEQHDTDVEDKPFPIPDDQITQWLVDTAIECLAVNYRVSFEELSVLWREHELIRIEPGIAGRILRALIDFKEFESFKKKETPEKSPSAEESSKSSLGELDGLAESNPAAVN